MRPASPLAVARRVPALPTAMAGAPGAGPSWYDPVVRGLLAHGPASAQRLSITIFHRVHAQADPLFPGEPDSVRFDALCAWLAQWFTVLPLDEAVRLWAERKLPPRALCITFDDGYADNAEVALPVLQRHGLPATFFIATGFLDGGRMWNDTVVEAIRRCSVEQLDLRALGVDGLDRLPVANTADRSKAIARILPAIKHHSPVERLALAERVVDACEAVDLPGNLMMRSDQVRELAAAGMQIGAHTVSHPILARLDDAQASQEMAASRDHLQQLLGQPVGLFAYPNGRPDHDYGQRDAELARKLGFQAAVTTAVGAARTGSDRFQLPRFSPWDRQRWRWAAQLVRNLGRNEAHASKTP